MARALLMETMFKINPIESKLKDKKYRGHGKSCLRMENHANDMAYLHDFAVPFA
jgi:hypothetical protein